MTHLHKFRSADSLRFLSYHFSLIFLNSSKCPIYAHSLSSSSLFGTLALNQNNNHEIKRRTKITATKKVEAALLQYLRYTRCFLFSDAIHITTNSPLFVKNLAHKFRLESDVSKSVARYLNYNPINEFEPFFESIGLEPSEFGALLPRNLMFLSDEPGLLDNYHVLCEYGIDPAQIGKIYREAREVFRYGEGVLQSKLQAFEQVGISKDVVSRAVTFNPTLLVNGVNEEFFELVRKLKCLGIENGWVEQQFVKEKFVEMTTPNWRQISHLLQLLQNLACNDEDISKLVDQRPDILFDHSGRSTLLLTGFLFKFGCTRSHISSILLGFPQVKVEKFVWNLRRAFQVLFDIEMDAVNIGRIIREHFTWIGTCDSLNKATTILAYSRSTKEDMCRIMEGNPLELKKWTRGGGAKFEHLPVVTREMRRRHKIKFLTSIGFVENSKEIQKALSVCQGKGDKLPERLDCLVKAGLSENDAAKLCKAFPRILSQSIEVLEAKISLLVDLGYPVSRLRSNPEFLSYSMDRVKVRCIMYRWLIDQNVVCPTLTFGSIIGCSESRFITNFVNRHPLGPAVWQEYKETFSSI